MNKQIFLSSGGSVYSFIMVSFTVLNIFLLASRTCWLFSSQIPFQLYEESRNLSSSAYDRIQFELSSTRLSIPYL